jgi:hypothetical protein
MKNVDEANTIPPPTRPTVMHNIPMSGGLLEEGAFAPALGSGLFSLVIHDGLSGYRARERAQAGGPLMRYSR